MTAMLWKIWILMRRDFIEEVSYRLNILIEVCGVLVYSGIFYFVAKVFSGSAAPYLARYRGDYFSFVLIGLAFTGYLNVGLHTFVNVIRNEQMMGTLEVILSTPTPLSVVLGARLLFNFLHNSLILISYFAFGVFLMGASYAGANWAAVPLIVLMSLAAFASLGIISAGFIIIYKRGDPINTVFGFTASLLGGVFFPVEVMPPFLQKIAAFVPLTYTLRLMRDALMRGAGFSALAPDLLILAALCAVLIPAGILFLSFALRRAKRDGTLTHY
jgi:ABC-2 type transport system permease protein